MFGMITFMGITGLFINTLCEVDTLIIIFSITISLDYITGTIAALAQKKWSACGALKGLFKKISSIAAILISIILDIIVTFVCEHYIALEFTAEISPLFCCLVLVWLNITELGSIIENSGILGVPIPVFLSNRLLKLKSKFDHEDHEEKK